MYIASRCILVLTLPFYTTLHDTWYLMIFVGIANSAPLRNPVYQSFLVLNRWEDPKVEKLPQRTGCWHQPGMGPFQQSTDLNEKTATRNLKAISKYLTKLCGDSTWNTTFTLLSHNHYISLISTWLIPIHFAMAFLNVTGFSPRRRRRRWNVEARNPDAAPPSVGADRGAGRRGALLVPREVVIPQKKEWIAHEEVCSAWFHSGGTKTLMEDHVGNAKKISTPKCVGSTCSITSCCTTEGTPQQGSFGLLKHVGYKIFPTPNSFHSFPAIHVETSQRNRNATLGGVFLTPRKAKPGANKSPNHGKVRGCTVCRTNPTPRFSTEFRNGHVWLGIHSRSSWYSIKLIVSYKSSQDIIRVGKNLHESMT